MLILDAATKLQIVLGGATTTNPLEFTAHYLTQAAHALALATGTSNGATDVDVVAASAGRMVKAFSLFNKDTVAATCTVKTDNGGTERIIFKCTLQPNELLIYEDGSGWRVYDSAGSFKTALTGTGRFMQTQNKVNGNTTYTTGPSTLWVFVRAVAGGGGGGGCTSVAAAAAAAGGGGAGGYAEKLFAVLPNTVYVIAVGAAGAGASGAAGGNGGDTTMAVGATTVTAKGGTGGPQAVAATTLTARAGGAGGTVSTNGDVNGAGQHGEYGVVLIVATPIVASGNGGNGPIGGQGGQGLVAVGNGNNGVGAGSGGGGSATGASAVRTGGNGVAGVLIGDEYS